MYGHTYMGSAWTQGCGDEMHISVLMMGYGLFALHRSELMMGVRLFNSSVDTQDCYGAGEVR